LRSGDRVNVLASASIELNQVLALVRDPELRETILGFPTDDPVGPVIPGSPEEDDTLTALAETFPQQLNFTQTVLQDIPILAVGPDTIAAPLGLGLEPVGGQVIVLEVTPDQAELIEFARQYTSVAFTALPKDEAYVPFEAGGVLVDDLFSLLDRIIAQLQDAGASLGN
jgi:hypothetical protein